MVKHHCYTDLISQRNINPILMNPRYVYLKEGEMKYVKGKDQVIYVHRNRT